MGIFIKHNDKINLVSANSASQQFMLTVIDPLKISNNNETKSRKRKRDSLLSLDESIDSNASSNPSSPNRKRCKLNNDSLMFNYAMMNDSNLESIPSPSPQQNDSNALSLSGLLTSNFDASPLRTPNVSEPKSSPSNNSKYSAFASFPIDDDMNNMDSSDDSDYYDQLIKESENKQNEKQKNDEIEKNEKIKKEQQKKEDLEQEQKRFDEGRYSLAISVIDCDRYQFETNRVLQIIANVLFQFMRIHRHPKLRIVVIATNKFHKQLYQKLLNEYGENENDAASMSLDLDCDDDEVECYKIFESDQRIIIYHGDYADIVCLKEIGICCQYFAFWSFDKKKGDRLNKIINKSCNDLSSLSIAKYKTAKKKCFVYSVHLNEENDGNIRCVLQIRMPSMNKTMQDYVQNAESAYSELTESYKRILNAFYDLTELTKPLKDEFVIKDVSNWNNKSLIKQEIKSLTQSVSPNTMSINNSDDLNKHKSDSLHFSLCQVPIYKCPQTSEWPKNAGGHWKDALFVYIQDRDKRDIQWNAFIFYEDADFVVIYDKYFKAKFHLMIMPKFKLKSVYDLDPMNASHIEMIEGLLARSKWIELGLMKRNKNINRMKCGFHAIPSMNQLHLHLLSDDMDSINLKNKKHFHSFTSPYFIPGKVMLKVLKDERKKFKINKRYYEQLLKQKLKCHFCFSEIRTMPKLKEHIKRCKFRGKNKKAAKHKFAFQNTNNDKNDYDDDDEDQYNDFKIMFDE